MALPQYYGNNLASPGERQPNGLIHFDAYGLVQAQLSFAIDSDPLNVADALEHYSGGVLHPDDLGFTLKSYKGAITAQVGNYSIITVDYMGINRPDGYTDAQITGPANTTAQPIETHPNFTKITDSTISSNILAGTPDDPKNNAIFSLAPPQPNGIPQYTFGGFGVSNTAATANKKAGIRQFLRPMVCVRGQIFFDAENGDRSAAMVNGVGRVLNGSGDLYKLITPNDAIGALSPDICLLTSATPEPIGKPDNYCAIKVTYDIMIGGQIGWDTDIYGKMADPIF
jgi:hypothetical protein